MDSIVVAIIGCVGSLLGSLLGVMTSNKLTQYRIAQLEEKVSKHNSIVERTYKLEGAVTELQHDVRDLKESRGEEIVMDKAYWRKWIKAAAVRAVKTIAQTAVATVGTAAVMGEVNWVMVGSAAALSGVLSLLTSVAGLPEVKLE